jgi:hypothetical protein
MQLRVARLCLDCEEVHDAQQCPICASESFAYLVRWVPVPERRSPPRAAAAPAAAPRSTRRPSPKTAIGFGVVGLGVVGLARWFAKGRKRIEDASLNRDVGDLK